VIRNWRGLLPFDLCPAIEHRSLGGGHTYYLICRVNTFAVCLFGCCCHTSATSCRACLCVLVSTWGSRRAP